MTKISSEEIKELYNFTRKHYVEYYDLQTELVDHLANAIEDRWKQDPSVKFQECLNREFSKFGVFGFMDVVEKRQSAMLKRYYNLLFKEGWYFVRQPKTILIIAIFLGLFLTIFQLPYGFVALIIFLAIEIVALLVLEIFRLRKYKKQVKNGTRKKYVLEELILNSGKISLFFISAPSFINFLYDLDVDFTSPTLIIIFSGLMVFQLMTAYLSFFLLPKKKNIILKKVYPELQFE